MMKPVIVVAAAVFAGVAAAAHGATRAPRTASVYPAARWLRSGAPSGARQRLVPAPTGNEVRYRVREQLAGVNLPSDAIGKTTAITGAIVVEDDGKVVAAESKFVVDLTTLKSDRERRDRYLQRRTLETERFATVELVPTALRGLRGSLPRSGALTFELLGDLTVRGVTRPTTWQVTANFDGSSIAGTASTSFTFAEFNLTRPRVRSVLSIDDPIRLEYDFRLVPDDGANRPRPSPGDPARPS